MVPYMNRFQMPNPTDDATWWSLNYGPIHFSMLSSEHDFSLNSEQYTWLANDLASVDRSQTPFLILTGHRPMYVDSDKKKDLETAAQLQATYEPLMQKYKVDVAFWGSVLIARIRCSGQIGDDADFVERLFSAHRHHHR